MFRRFVRLVVLFVFIVMVVGAGRFAQPVVAADDFSDVRYFDATGHDVRGSFRRFWEQNGGLAIFGYPISTQFNQEGRDTQIFERAVFQAFPENADNSYGVQLMLLGRDLTAGRAAEAPFQPVAAARGDATYFPETRHQVGGAFLSYWQRSGGLPVFGYPISEAFDERNPTDDKTYTVQYFERARFEYHPEMEGTDYDVLLGQLGAQYASMSTIPPDVLERQPGPLPASLVAVDDPIQVVVNHSFISPLVERFGSVAVGQQVFIASNTTLRADPGHRLCIGNETNLQDNILFLSERGLAAPGSDCGAESSSTGERTSIAHQAVVKNSRIGSFTFVGFHARLENVVLEDGAFVLHGAVLRNVTIGKDRIVPIGAVITTQAQADALPLKTEANADFQRDVLEVNEEFAESYIDLYEEGGFDAVTGVGVNPQTSFNPSVMPTLGANVHIEEFARVVGDVRLGDNSTVGRRSSIRADEGTPMIIGANATISDHVTFHALKGTNIRIGSHLTTGNNVVFHGPLVVGDNLTIGNDAILFRSVVGNNVTLGKGAIVIDATLRDGVTVPDGAVITTQAQADALK